MQFVCYLLTALYSYLIGSINFGIIVSKLVYKKDVRTLGSGNAGTTNILRTFGKTAAFFVFAGDALKGVAAVLIARQITLHLPEMRYCVFFAAFFAVIGHLFPVFFGFRGGKGVATALGIALTLEPVAGLILLLVFIIVAISSKRISLGSVIAALCYPVATYFYVSATHGEMLAAYVISSVLIALLIIFMHRGNIKRLLKGEESKMSFGKK